MSSHQLCHLSSQDLDKELGYLELAGIRTDHLPMRLQWQYLFRVEVSVDSVDDMRDTLIEFIGPGGVFHTVVLPRGKDYVVRVGGGTGDMAGMGVELAGPFKIRWKRLTKRDPVQTWGRTFRLMRVALYGRYMGCREPWPPDSGEK